MLNTLHSSLRTKIATGTAGVIGLITLFLWFYFPARMNDLAETWVERRAVGIALVLARALEPSIDFDEASSAAGLLNGLDAAPGAVYGVLYRADRTALAAWNGEHVPPLSKKIEAGVSLSERKDRLDVITPIATKSGGKGTLVLGFSLLELQRETRANRTVVGLVALLLFVLGLGLSLIAGSVMVRPVRSLTALSTYIVETGDLTRQVETHSTDEVGQLSRAFRAMVAGQRSILLNLQQLASGLAGVMEQSSRVSTSVAGGASTIRARAHDTSAAMERSLTSSRGLAQNADALHSAADESDSALRDMAVVTSMVKNSITTMVNAVRETAVAIEQMSRGVGETSRNLNDVNSLLSDTSAALTELGTSFREVESNAKDTAQFSEDARQDAEHGVLTVQRTVQGINEIRELSSTGAEVIKELARDIGEIGKILLVINDLSDQTNLLSLNAAIVAAQAGDRGRGFSVVADEIKQLAERTAASTREIASLIKRIHQQSDRAAQAMSASIKSVNHGVELASQTDDALQKILQSSQRSTHMASSIATAAVEQGRTLQEIAKSVQRIAENVEQLSTRSVEQAQGSEQIVNSTERTRELVEQLQQGGNEQTRASSRLGGAVEATHELVRVVRTAQLEQIHEAEQVLKDVDAMREVSETQATSIEKLEQVIAKLHEHVSSLQSATSRFRV